MNFNTLVGAIASLDFSTSQFSFVQMTGSAVDFEIGLSTLSTVVSIGVLQNKPDTSGHPAEVAMDGVCKVKFGGSITQGAFIITGANGYAYTESTALNDYKVAIALQTGTATGVYYVRLVTPFREGTA